MTKTQKQKKIFREQLDEAIFPADRYGNYKWWYKGMSPNETHYRIQVKKLVWRGEIRIAGQWKKLTGGKFDAAGTEDAIRFYAKH